MNKTRDEIYNILASGGISWREATRNLLALSGREVIISPDDCFLDVEDASDGLPISETEYRHVYLDIIEDLP